MANTANYNGNSNLPKEGVQIKWTPEMVAEFKKCKDDPVYFIETYGKIVSVDDGLVPFILYDYQREILAAYPTNNNICLNQSRQSGKCVTGDAKVTIRNKKTGEIRTISIQELKNL